MKKKRNKLTAICAGCRFSEIKSGTEFICNREGQASARVASAVIDVFFGDDMECYEPSTIAS